MYIVLGRMQIDNLTRPVANRIVACSSNNNTTHVSSAMIHDFMAFIAVIVFVSDPGAGADANLGLTICRRVPSEGSSVPIEAFEAVLIEPPLQPVLLHIEEAGLADLVTFIASCSTSHKKTDALVRCACSTIDILFVCVV
jgi:hypothetical protein